MSVEDAIATSIRHPRIWTIRKAGLSIGPLVLVSLCVWALLPSVAECAAETHTAASLREAAGFDHRDQSALNLLGIRYAKGRGVKRNPGLAMRYFLRSASQGYTPAMANLGTLYEIGAVRHSDFQRAYAWVRAALWFGVPEEDHDATVLKLWMIAAQLRPDRIESAERLAGVIAIRIIDSCKCSPGQDPELASIGFP